MLRDQKISEHGKRIQEDLAEIMDQGWEKQVVRLSANQKHARMK
jgi:hypothetical protein